MSICPGLADVYRACPQPDCPCVGYLTALIPHINDNHHWSREKIADWCDIINEDPEVDLSIKKKGEQ